MKLDENYEEMASALNSTFSEIESLISNKKIMVDGQDHPVEVFLGGDYKVNSKCAYNMYSAMTSLILMQFLLMMLGLNAANSNYACVWCTIHKDDR